MMTSTADASATAWDPVAIIKEYASNPSVKIRRNAATALAALSSRQDAVRSLLDMALDPDNAQSDLSAHIFKELLTLDDRERQTVLAHLYAAIDDKNQPQRQSAAYIALARLRAFGVRLNPSSRSWRSRLAIARVGAWTAQAQKARRPTFTCTFFMVVAGFVVSLLFMMYFYTRLPTILAGEGVFPILIAIIAMMATSKALVSVLGSVPAYLHIDRVASGLRDIGMAALCVASLSSMLTPIIMTMLRFSGNTWDWVKAVLLASAMLGLVTAVVRAATLFATDPPERLLALGDDRHGRSSRRFVERRANRRRIFQIATGTAIGGLTAYLLGPLMRIGYNNQWPADFTRMVEGTLQFALMAAPSIAVAFAFLDYPAGILEWLPGGQQQNGHWTRATGTVVRGPFDTHRYGGAIRLIQRIVCRGSLVFVVAITLWIVVKLLTIAPVIMRAESGFERELRYWVAGTPAAVSFDVPFLQSFSANLQGGAPASLALYTWNGEFTNGSTVDVPPLNCTVKQEKRAVRPRSQQIPAFQLGRGCYEVEVLPLSEGTGLRQSLRTLIDGWLLTRYKSVPNSGNNDEGRLQLQLRLNPFKNTGRVLPLIPKSRNPGTLSEAGAISWIVHSAPVQRTIEVKKRMAFFASVDARQFRPDEVKRGPDGLPLDPDDPAASTDRAYDLLDQGLFNRIPSRRLFKLELTAADASTPPIRDARTAGDGILTLRRDLDPGRYVLTFKPPAEDRFSTRTNWFALNAALAPAAAGSFLPAERVLLSRETPAVVEDRLTGAWKIERLPMTVTFTLRERRHVITTIPENAVVDPFTRSTSASPDYTLQLNGKGVPIVASDDDPEVITWTLEPGNYTLSVFGTRLPPAAGAWLTLDVRPPAEGDRNTPAGQAQVVIPRP